MEARPLLRVLTCGSVDDGKSTLIGRLLHDTASLPEDELATLAADSRRHGTRAGELDFALLLDGLEAEREQGITIDVAYRFFDTARAKFIVADCPGHEQYTRNMATGASTADVAVVLVDVRKGVLPQTRRHSRIVSLMGIGHVVLAVNKMDLVDFDQAAFQAVVAEYRALAALMGIGRVDAVPLSALRGDNLLGPSTATPWYDGPGLLQVLEAAAASGVATNEGAFRLPVQWVCRTGLGFRGFAGTLLGGDVALDDTVVALPSGHRSRVKSIHVGTEAVARARAGQAVVVELEDAIDVGRGDVLAAAADAPGASDQFGAHLVWLDTQPLLPGRPYWLQVGTASVGARVGEIKHQLDVDTQEHIAAKRLELNAVAAVNLDLDQPVVFEPYARCRRLGGFVLVDRQTHATVAAGVIDFALRRADNIHWQAVDVDKRARARIKGQVPRCVWLTGLSGAGKSTIANLVEKKLLARGLHTYLLDGDNLRHGLNRNLGFTDEDRVENIRRVGEVGRLMVDAGLVVLVSLISPFRAERRMVREHFEDGEFIEVFVDTPMQECERRDAKGLYAKARRGELPNFTGIGSPYEVPLDAELRLDTMAADEDALAEAVVARILAP